MIGSTDILHFPVRLPVTQIVSGCYRAATLIRDAVLPNYSCDDGPRSSQLRFQTHGPVGFVCWSEQQSALHGHAAASTDGHVSHDADRLASMRVRRAAAARNVRSAGTASPVPRYISSGVCPRNAEWGSTRLCSST